MTVSFNFSSIILRQNQFISFGKPVVKRFQIGKIDCAFFCFGKFDFHNSRLDRKSSLFPIKCWFLVKKCFIWKSQEYTKGHRPNALVIARFDLKSYTEITANLLGKIGGRFPGTEVFERKYV